jgi:hypothetical protein
MSDIFVASLRNRIRALNELWQRAVSDMTLDHVNHKERDGVLPIAFSLSHYMRAQDQSASGPFLRQPTEWDSGGWAKKVGVTVDRFGREESVEEMEQIRFGDFDAPGAGTRPPSSSALRRCSRRSRRSRSRKC